MGIEMSDSLEDRLRAFDLLELPGQPQGMHMGTSYLMHDLWNEIQRLEAENARLRAALKKITNWLVPDGRSAQDVASRALEGKGE